MMGVYTITNKVNGRQYVGMTVSIKRRFAEHKSPCRIRNPKFGITKAIKKHGLDNFSFDIVEVVKDEERLSDREIFWVDKLKPRYNMTKGGIGNKPIRVSDELRKLLSEKGKAQWARMSDKDKKAQIKNNLTGHKKGYTMSDETKEKIRITNSGKKQSKETIEKRMAKLRGRKKDNSYLHKRVAAIKNNNVVKEFDSVLDAGRFAEIHSSGIVKALKGVQNTAGGFYWKYLD